MQIQINTDNQLSSDEALRVQAEAILTHSLERFSDRITRAEVHLSDENSAAKSGSTDKRCVLEVRIVGRQPIAVTNGADTVEKALAGAARKMRTTLASTFDRLDSKKGLTALGDVMTS
ncbi:MAG: HPF/RaiA family ribosome-associated protein [Gemmatimonadaceae bacterium]|nr:HPF/RaiA family ribosome-associated protein [Gemmatimonadaceae bacterium]